MSYQTVMVLVEFTREQFIEMLLLNGIVQVQAKEVSKSAPVEVVIKSVRDHEKFGAPGVEDGGRHFFKALVVFRGRVWSSSITAVSDDDGKTYSSTLTFEYFQDDRMIR